MKSYCAYILLAAIAALSGCGSLGGRYVAKASASSYGGGTTSPYTTAGGNDYSCPGAPNVVPDYDYNHDGSGRYTVCTSQSSSDKIQIHGQTATSDTICVFPAQVVDAQHIYVKPDLQTGGPLVTCIPISGSGAGAYAAFPGVNYNALFIVEGPDKDAMQSCLIGGNYFACPHYSYGKFR